jgi:hypothetical protein
MAIEQALLPTQDLLDQQHNIPAALDQDQE